MYRILGVDILTLMSTQIVNVIQNVGFPIAAFGLMYRFATVTLKENTQAIKSQGGAIRDLAIAIAAMKR